MTRINHGLFEKAQGQAVDSAFSHPNFQNLFISGLESEQIDEKYGVENNRISATRWKKIHCQCNCITVKVKAQSHHLTRCSIIPTHRVNLPTFSRGTLRCTIPASTWTRHNDTHCTRSRCRKCGIIKRYWGRNF